MTGNDTNSLPFYGGSIAELEELGKDINTMSVLVLMAVLVGGLILAL